MRPNSADYKEDFSNESEELYKKFLIFLKGKIIKNTKNFRIKQKEMRNMRD